MHIIINYDSINILVCMLIKVYPLFDLTYCISKATIFWQSIGLNFETKRKNNLCFPKTIGMNLAKIHRMTSLSYERLTTL